MPNRIKIDKRNGNKGFAVLSYGDDTAIIQGNKGIHPRTILLNADELRDLSNALGQCLKLISEAA